MSDIKGNTIVQGFVFESTAEVKQAEKEIEGVKFIKEKLDMNKPEMVLQIYNKMVRQKLFETPIGYSYLRELQEYLHSSPHIDNGDILPIAVRQTSTEPQARRSRQETKQQEKTTKKYINIDYKKRYRTMCGITVALLVCVFSMFAISATVNTPTVFNYEQKLIDRYAEWEKELDEREARIVEREHEIDGQITE